MRSLIIDRFEGTFAICEDQEKKMFAIEKNELPDAAGEGTVLTINDEGVITINKEETKRRREKNSPDAK